MSGLASLEPVFQAMITNDFKKMIYNVEQHIEETSQIYVESDSVTLNSIIGSRYIICDKTNKLAEVAQIVLVTEYRAFMKKLLDMRYDTSLRTKLNLSMTDDRKHNLQRLYNSCLEQGWIKGAHALKIMFHIAWIRTLEFFKLQAQFSLQVKL